MLKITSKIANQLFEEIGYGKIGIYCSQGAVIGDNEFVIVYTEDTQEVYLAHISEFAQDGVLMKLKGN
jgi:hypothetical protein